MPEAVQRVKGGRIVQLDGLRGFAVLAVVINHFNPQWLVGGFVGVDIFFVLSGYVVTLSVLKRNATSFASGILEFYKRRFLRILPALILCIVVTTILSVLFIPKSWLSNSLEATGIWSIIGGSNIAQIITNDGYFAPSSEYNPFTHTWSLGIEEQFYLLIPIFLLLLGRKSVSWVVGVLSTVSVVLAISWAGNQQSLAFYSLFSRFWELGLGVLLAVLSSSKFSRHLIGSQSSRSLNIFKVALSFSGLLFILYSILFNGSNVLTPWPGSVLPVLGTSLIILSTFIDNQSVHAQQCFTDRLLVNPVLIWFGFISYALYLWHWPVIVLMKWTVGLENLFLILVGLVVSIVLACLSTYCLEIPFSKLSRFGPRRVVGFGVLAAFLGTIIVAQLFENRDSLALSTVNKHRSDWYAEYSPTNGNAKEEKTIFVLGNSHALAYSPLLTELHQRNGWNTRIFPMEQCAVGSVMSPVWDESCQPRIDSVIQSILDESKPGDIVWFASLRMNRYIDQGDYWKLDVVSHVQTDGYQYQLEQAYQEIRPLISRFEEAGLTVLLDRPKPVFKSPPFRCVDWFNQSNHLCDAGLSVPRDEFVFTSAGVNEKIDLLDDEFDSLVVWDPAEVLCDSESCNAMKGDKPLFFDADHLSNYGNLILVDSLEKTLRN